MPNIKKINLSKLEFVIAFIGSVLLGIFLAIHAVGGPISTDVLLYMNSGLNRIEDTLNLNRYFHIFLESLFLNAAPTPLVGFQYFWAFLIATTTLLIYLNARSFTSQSNPFHGLLAIAIFFSIATITEWAGVAGADTTAMFMVMVMVTVFMFLIRSQHRSKWLLAALGFLFYLSFKTKETTLITGLLIVGLGFSENKFDLLYFRKQIGYVLVGFLAGVVFFAIISWIVLGDPLFGLRFSNIRDFATTYVPAATGVSHLEPITENLYTKYLFQALYIPFALYLVSGIKTSPDLDPARRVIWWLPLAITVFVSLTTDVKWWNPRFLLPALPLISLLAPQFLNFTIPASTREKIKWGAFFSIGMVLVLLVRLVMRYLLPKIGWDISAFLVYIFEPFLFSILLALLFFWKHSSLGRSILITVLLIAILTSPLIRSFKIMVEARPNQVLSGKMFYPFSSFSEEIRYSPDMRFYIADDVWETMGVSGYAKNQDELLSLFNVYFDASSTRENFPLIDKSVDKYQDLLASNYTYVLLSTIDWQNITADPQARTLLEQNYQVFFDQQGLLVFLKAR
jgi:hypothetical protein